MERKERQGEQKMSRLKKHIGEGEEVEINGDIFILKPLGAEYFGDFMKMAKGFSGAKDDTDTEGMFKNFTDETMVSINRVVIDTLKISLPDESEEEINIFAGKYMMKLLPAISKMNGIDSGDSRAKQKIEAIQRMRAKQDKDESSPEDTE